MVFRLLDRASFLGTPSASATSTCNPPPTTTNRMPSTNMFSKLRSSVQVSLDANPIGQLFEIGKQVANSGPEQVWKIHDAYRISDGKECSVFIFEKRCAEKLHKPKRKEIVTEILRNSIHQLEQFRHPKILNILHPIEECQETLAFASEPVFASLANILAFQEAASSTMQTEQPQQQQQQQQCHQQQSSRMGMLNREYTFLDIEYKYGIFQITEALSYLHYARHVIHRNVCPGSILITKKGTWKLAGLEFIEQMTDTDGIEPVACQPWTSRLSKMIQPNLDYTAPECQTQSICNVLSDMFSLGMVICSIFNQGKPLILANNSSSSYLKQLELLEDQVHKILPRIPVPLQEATARLLSKETRQRPTAQLLILIKYFDDPAVHALQYLDAIKMKDTKQKNRFYTDALKDALPYIPKKLWYQHVWPSLQQEMLSKEVLAAVLQSVLFLIQESSKSEYETYILPSLRMIFQAPRTVQATVTILENLHVILEKTSRDDIATDILPMLYNAFDGAHIQILNAALIAVINISDYLDEIAIKQVILPKTKQIYEKNQNDSQLVSNVLSCIEKCLDRLDKSQIIDEVIPLLYEIRLSDPMITLRVVSIYRLMLSDKKYGLSVNLMATKVMPSLLPQTVNPTLNLEQFTILSEVLRDMLEQIDRNQRNKLKLDNLSLPSPERHRPLRHQYSSDNMNVPPFNIPNLRIEQRKTSSAEDMQRKNSTGGLLGGWWFGGSPSSSDSNFLRVASGLPNRRLSDNTLMTPKIRIAPSCASSPGGTPGSGLPTRRHSSIGAQERRGSTMNLSPPTGGLGYSSVSREGSSLSVPSTSYLARSMIGGSMPNTSSSVPYLLSSSMQSIRSRRSSAALGGSQGGSSGLLQQLGSGMHQLFGGRQ